jgi:tryptophan synthase alpha chain
MGLELQGAFHDTDRRHFRAAAGEGKKAFVSYIMGGDPDRRPRLAVMKGLPAAGVDVIELGMPFTDPMADGPTIQAAGQRALEGGMTMDKVWPWSALPRRRQVTPIVLMGYYNPIYSRGVDRFLAEALEAGDRRADRRRPAARGGCRTLHPRAKGRAELHPPCHAHHRRQAPAESAAEHQRLRLLRLGHRDHRGCGRAGDRGCPEVARIKRSTDLPVIVGFGINTPEAAQGIAIALRVADGCVVGSRPSSRPAFPRANRPPTPPKSRPTAVAFW